VTAASATGGAGAYRTLFAERSPIVPDGLLAPETRSLFEMLEWGFVSGTYNYQHPLAGRSGHRVRVDGRELVMLSSYDYLGLIGHPAIEQAAVDAIRTYGTGTGGVRLLTGTTSLHAALDAEVAAWKRVDAALTFSSGYLANLAAISALIGPRDAVILDRLAHRSLFDACRLGGVRPRTFAHNRLDDLEHQLAAVKGRRTVVIVEGAYSMDGDLCPLRELVAIKRKFGAYLLVDDSHSLGVLGPSGRGVDEHFGVDPGDVDLCVGSLSKAIPANGGFIAGRREIIVYLQHAAGAFVFSSALSPSSVAAIRAALPLLSEPERRVRAHTVARTLVARLTALGYRVGRTETPIVPVLIGDDKAAHQLARRLFDRNVLATAVVFPAVPQGTARLRLCATAAHTDRDIEEAMAAFEDVLRER